MIYVRMGQGAALEERVQEGMSGGSVEKQTPYGLEELEFLASLQDADREHGKVEHWHRSD